LNEKDKDQALYADSSYTGEDQENVISKHKIKNEVHEKGYRIHPLTEIQNANNKIKSKTIVRVEHVFGFMEQSMNGLYLRCVGLVRATGMIGLMNLTYNLFLYDNATN
jgi:IS5 family transposase